MIPKYCPYFNSEEIKSLLEKEDDAVEKFEKMFADLVNSKYALAFPYGRSALYSIIKSYNITNSEIIIPAYTCVVVPNIILATKNIPRFVDIKLTDYNMNIGEIVNVLSQKTRVIIPTHMYGYPMDCKKLRDIIEDYRYGEKILIIEDACLLLLSKDVGKYSHAAFYSFNIGKHIVTLDGGMVTTNNEEIYQKLLTFRHNNYKKANSTKILKKLIELLASYMLFNRKIYGFIYKWWKSLTFLQRFTRNWNLEYLKLPDDLLVMYSNLQAKIGMVQIKKAKEIVKRKSEIAKEYNNNFKDVENLQLPPIREGSSYSHYTIRVKNREIFLQNMEKQGIHVGTTFNYSLPHLSMFSSFCYDKNNFQKSLKAANEVVNLPIFPSLTNSEIKYTIEAVIRFYRSQVRNLY